MKKLTLLAAFAALVSLASCQKEEAVNGMEETNVVYPEFTASIDVDETKTTVDVSTGKVSWDDSDIITVSDNSKSAVYKIKSIDSSTGTATFEVKDDTQPVLGSGPYTATYGSAPSTSQKYSATAGKLYMTAPSSSNKSFTFTVVGGLMKLNLTKSGESVKSITVTGTPAGGSQTTYTLTCESAQSISSARNFCIALPAGSYNKIVITNSTGKVCILNASSALSISDNRIRPVTIGSSKLNFIIGGALKGLFTVDSNGTQVRFSQGNMYYDGNSNKFKFENNQCDFRHYNGIKNDVAVINGIKTTTPSGTVGSYYWSNDESVAYAVSYNDPSKTGTDIFFTNAAITTPRTDFTVNGQTNVWRTLSNDEWAYLMGTRSQTNLYAKAMVNGIKGLIIFPDGYNGTTSVEGIATVNAPKAVYPTASIAAATWTAMESEGCVFLPAASTRGNSSDTAGRYWASSGRYAVSAYALYFENSSSGVVPSYSTARNSGYSVRLVCAAR